MKFFNIFDNNKPDYNFFAEKAIDELKILQDKLFDKYDINSYENWYYNQGTGLFTFSTGGDQLNFTYFEVGTFSLKSNTWMWSWHNESSAVKVKADCEQVKEFGIISGYDKLTTGFFESDETEAWELAAIALKIAGGVGVYRPISGDLQVFTILKEVVDNQTAQVIKDKYIECDKHDSQRIAFVCQHLINNKKVGFEEAFETWENMELEDEEDLQAWCDECEKIRLQQGEWNDTSMAFADIKLVCEKCYFDIKDYNLEHNR